MRDLSAVSVSLIYGLLMGPQIGRQSRASTKSNSMRSGGVFDFEGENDESEDPRLVIFIFTQKASHGHAIGKCSKTRKCLKKKPLISIEERESNHERHPSIETLVSSFSLSQKSFLNRI